MGLSLLLAVVMLVSSGISAGAAAPVAHYLPAGAGEVSVRIVVSRPAPAALIVLQQLPAGVKLLAADPPPVAMDPRRGLVRWLFRQPRPGPVTLSLRLSRTVAPGELTGEVRFRHPAGGETVVVPIIAAPARSR